VIDDNLSWHYHIDQMIPKLNKASYVIRVLKPLLSLEALRMVYYSTVSGVYQLIVKSYLKPKEE
jgi:hypothetical protein